MLSISCLQNILTAEVFREFSPSIGSSINWLEQKSIVKDKLYCARLADFLCGQMEPPTIHLIRSLLKTGDTEGKQLEMASSVPKVISLSPRTLKPSQSEYRSFDIQHRCPTNYHQKHMKGRKRKKPLSFPVHLGFLNLSHVLSTMTSNMKLDYVGQTNCHLCNLIE